MTTTQRTDRPPTTTRPRPRAGRVDRPRGGAAPRLALVARREVSSKLVDRTFLLGTLRDPGR